MEETSLARGNPPNTPPSVSTLDISTPPSADRKEQLETFLQRRRIPDVLAVPDIPNGFLVRGRLVTPETVFSQKDELEGNQRIDPLLYLEAMYGLRCPGLDSKGVPPHGLSLKWKGRVQVPIADIHHLVKYRDAQGRVRKLHMARYLRMVCHDHNAEYGEPVTYPFEAVQSIGGVPLGSEESPQLERERTSRPDSDSVFGEASSLETAMSQKMTWRYRQHLYHPHTGVMKDAGTVRGLKELADELEEKNGLGKAQTYERYLRHDVAVKYLSLFDEDGIAKVKRTLTAYPLSRLGIAISSQTERQA